MFNEIPLFEPQEIRVKLSGYNILVHFHSNISNTLQHESNTWFKFERYILVTKAVLMKYPAIPLLINCFSSIVVFHRVRERRDSGVYHAMPACDVCECLGISFFLVLHSQYYKSNTTKRATNPATQNISTHNDGLLT